MFCFINIFYITFILHIFVNVSHKNLKLEVPTAMRITMFFLVCEAYRWRQKVSLKHWYLHGITTEKNITIKKSVVMYMKIMMIHHVSQCCIFYNKIIKIFTSFLWVLNAVPANAQFKAGLHLWHVQYMST
jgi:hypothetical protein